MTTQPEALRLADELDAYHTRSCHKEAAAELRRLHELNEDKTEIIASLSASNQELLEALRAMTTASKRRDETHWTIRDEVFEMGCAAIAKAEGRA